MKTFELSIAITLKATSPDDARARLNEILENIHDPHMGAFDTDQRQAHDVLSVPDNWDCEETDE